MTCPMTFILDVFHYEGPVLTVVVVYLVTTMNYSYITVSVGNRSTIQLH